MARRFTATLDIRITAESLKAIDWYAERADVSFSEAARYFLPSRVPDFDQGRDDPADVHERIRDLEAFREVELDREIESAQTSVQSADG